MNVRRFIADTSRAALREVREALGGDAVILSNRAIEGGVEIIAAEPDELTRITAPAKPPVAAQAPRTAARSAAQVPLRRDVPDSAEATPAWLTQAQILGNRRRLAGLLEQSDTNRDGEDIQAGIVDLADSQRDDVRLSSSALATPRTPTMVEERSQAVPIAPVAIVARAPQAPPLPIVPPAPQRAPVQQREQGAEGIASDLLAGEIRSIKGLIAEQLSSIAFGEGLRRQPAKMKLLRDLIGAGLSAALSRQLENHLPSDLDYAAAREWATKVLQRNLVVDSPLNDIIDRGGIYALVGPTGVGKTTTAAKLAARFALKHGVDKLALITTDAYRIGAQDQLRIYGKILGIAVHTVHDQAALASTLSGMKNKRLVLIDTAGLAQRDARVSEQLTMLSDTGAKRIVTLNATVQAETLEETVRAYAGRDCSGCIMTKLDEAVRIGGILDVVIRHRLRIHFITHGQRVPEDILHPQAAYLVHRLMRQQAPNKVFDVQEEQEPAWLAALALSCQGVNREVAAHV